MSGVTRYAQELKAMQWNEEQLIKEINWSVK